MNTENTNLAISPTDVGASFKYTLGQLKGFKRYFWSFYLIILIISLVLSPAVYIRFASGLGFHFSYADNQLLAMLQHHHQYPFNFYGYAIQVALTILSIIVGIFAMGAILAMAQNWLIHKRKKWFDIYPASQIVSIWKYIAASLLYFVVFCLFCFGVGVAVIGLFYLFKGSVLSLIPFVLACLAYLVFFIFIPIIYPVVMEINSGHTIGSGIVLWWNNKWAFFQVQLNVFVLAFAGVATLGIGFIWLFPWWILTLVKTYLNCKAE